MRRTKTVRHEFRGHGAGGPDHARNRRKSGYSGKLLRPMTRSSCELVLEDAGGHAFLPSTDGRPSRSRKTAVLPYLRVRLPAIEPRELGAPRRAGANHAWKLTLNTDVVWRDFVPLTRRSMRREGEPGPEARQGGGQRGRNPWRSRGIPTRNSCSFRSRWIRRPTSHCGIAPPRMRQRRQPQRPRGLRHHAPVSFFDGLGRPGVRDFRRCGGWRPGAG